MKIILKIKNIGKQSRHRSGLDVIINDPFRSAFASTCFAANIGESDDDILISCRGIDRLFGNKMRSKL